MRTMNILDETLLRCLLRVLVAPMVGFCLVVAVGCQPVAETANNEPVVTQPLPAQRATAGVGKQGEKLQAHNQTQKIISGPAGQLFQVRQRAIFDIQIPQALQLYKATNGRAQRSHDEFVREILQANNLVLPELRAGMVYQFNTEAEELWVYPEDEVPAPQ